MKILKITWRDSRRYIYQMEKTEECSIVEIITIGFLVKEDKKSIVLCQDLIDEDIRGVMCIPKENIISVKKVT